MHVLQGSVAERSGNYLCIANGLVLGFVVMERVCPILLCHDELVSHQFNPVPDAHRILHIRIHIRIDGFGFILLLIIDSIIY